MRLKLDENMSLSHAEALRSRSVDVVTVRDEGLGGATDETLFERCRSEERALVTLDLDFANPFRFPPVGTSGIIVLRPPIPSLSQIAALLNIAVDALSRESIDGKI